MIEASTNKKTLDFRGFPVDLNIQKDSEMNIKRSVSYVTAESHYNHGYVLMLGS